MKKTINILFTLVILVIALKCNIVFAAKELTCIYEKGSMTDPYMLIQYSDGSTTIRRNTSDSTDINDPNWLDLGKFSADGVIIEHKNTKSYDEEKKEFTACPEYGNQNSWNQYIFEFYDDYFLGRQKCISKDTMANEDKYIQTFPSDDDEEEIENEDWKNVCQYRNVTLYINDETFKLKNRNRNITTIKTGFSFSDLKEKFNGECPPDLYQEAINNGPTTIVTYYIEEHINSKKQTLIGVGEEGQIEIPEFTDCNSLLGDPNQSNPGTPAYYIVKIFNVIKYVAIILLIVMSMLDFVTAVASSDNDAIKKATNKTIKRAILCVIILILPFLIEVILKYASDRAIDLCGVS